MADKRINALATTASSTASDDFIAVDGTTNGTRKLNAFSPTFGGNATVTGTLTVNSTLTATSTAQAIRVSGAGITMDTDGVGASASLRFVDGPTPRFWIYKLTGDSNLYFRDMTNGRMQLQLLPGATSSNAISTFNSNLEVTSTTASTTTSSGALVVGNGTSGGLGVGGSINTGGTLRFHTNTNLPGVGSIGISATYGLNMYASTGSSYDFTVFNAAGSSLILNPTGTQNLSFPGTLTVASNFSIASTGFYAGGGTPGAGRFLYSATAGTMLCGQAGSSYDLSLANSTGTTILGVPTGTVNVSIPSTSISTTTSSGALVVSGGVGVAGAINAGSTITSTNGSGSGLLGMRSSSGNASYVFWSETGVADRGILGFNNGSSTLSYRSFSSSFSTGTEVFSITSGGNVTAGGSVQTAAPSGGTAAAWKLGTVATVSPTSPNRTIEVDIGGTIYYIHAKTTNN